MHANCLIFLWSQAALRGRWSPSNKYSYRRRIWNWSVPMLLTEGRDRPVYSAGELPSLTPASLCRRNIENGDVCRIKLVVILTGSILAGRYSKAILWFSCLPPAVFRDSSLCRSRTIRVAPYDAPKESDSGGFGHQLRAYHAGRSGRNRTP